MDSLLDKIEYVPPFRIAFSNDFSNQYRTFTCWKYLKRNRYLAISNGRILRILDTQKKEYILTYLHKSKIFKIAPLTEDKLALLCFIAPLGDVNELKQIVVDVIQLPLISTNRHKTTFVKRYRQQFTELVRFYGTNIPYFITYSNRYIEFSLRNGMALQIDTEKHKTTQFQIIHNDHFRRKLFPDRFFRKDENLLAYSIGNAVFSFPNFSVNRLHSKKTSMSPEDVYFEQNYDDDDDVNDDDILGDYDTWKTNFSPFGSLSCFYFPHREQDSMIPEEIIFATQYNYTIEMLEHTGSSKLVSYDKNKPRIVGQNRRNSIAINYVDEPKEHEKLLDTLSFKDTRSSSSGTRTDYNNSLDSILKFPYETSDHVEQFTIPPEEHNSLLVGQTWGCHIVIMDIRNMRAVEKIFLKSSENELSYLEEALQSNSACNFEIVVNNGNEIFVSFLNFSDVFVFRSKTLCDTSMLEKRVDTFINNFVNYHQQNSSSPIIRHFTRIVCPRGLTIFEFPSSLLYYDILNKNLGSLKSSSSGHVRVREIKLSRFLSIPKRKVEKMILGYRCEMSAKEKVDIFMFFWECKMMRRCWSLIRQIEFEDQYSIYRLKQMFLLIFAEVERGWFFGVDPLVTQRVAQEYPSQQRRGPGKFFRSSLAMKLFHLLWRQKEYEFLMNVLTTSCTENLFQRSSTSSTTTSEEEEKKRMRRRRIRRRRRRKRTSREKFRRWVSLVKKEIILKPDFEIEKHPDFRLLDLREFPATNLTCTIDNLKQLFDRKEMFQVKIGKKKSKKKKKNKNNNKNRVLDDIHYRNLVLWTSEGKTRFHVHLEVVLTRSIILYGMIRNDQKLWNKIVNRRKKKTSKMKVVNLKLNEIKKDVDLETILGSCYTRDIRPVRIMKKYGGPGRTVRGIREGNRRETRVKGRVIHLAQKYGDNDILVDMQIHLQQCVEILSLIKHREHKEETLKDVNEVNNTRSYTYLLNIEFERVMETPTKNSRGRKICIHKYCDQVVEFNLLTPKELRRERKDFKDLMLSNGYPYQWGLVDPMVDINLREMERSRVLMPSEEETRKRAKRLVEEHERKLKEAVLRYSKLDLKSVDGVVKKKDDETEIVEDDDDDDDDDTTTTTTTNDDDDDDDDDEELLSSVTNSSSYEKEEEDDDDDEEFKKLESVDSKESEDDNESSSTTIVTSSDDDEEEFNETKDFIEGKRKEIICTTTEDEEEEEEIIKMANTTTKTEEEQQKQETDDDDSEIGISNGGGDISESFSSVNGKESDSDMISGLDIT